MYAKFIDRRTIFPFRGRVLRTAERTYVNPSAETLAENDYFPVESDGTLIPQGNSDTLYRFEGNRIVASVVLRDTEGQT